MVALADAPSLEARKRAEIKAWDADQLVDVPRRDRARTACTRRSTSRRTPGCAAARCSGCGGATSTSTPGGCRCARRWCRSRTRSQISDVKTGTGRRTIDLDAGTVDVLRAWRNRARRGEAAGSSPRTDDLVFVKADGIWIHPDIFSQIFDRTVAKLDVPTISLHDLRHTHATLLLKAGVPVKVVSERLGHANVAFTMNVYQHVRECQINGVTGLA